MAAICSVLRSSLLALSLLLALGSLALPAAGSSPAVSEYGLKAVLLLKLTRFTYSGEEQQAAHWSLCLLGDNPFGSRLQQLVAEEAEHFSLRTLRRSESAAACQLVFVAASESGRLRNVISHLGQYQGLLTVSDIKGFAQLGGMIEMRLDESSGQGIELLINREAAARQQVHFNAQLLRLARLVPAT